jgi:uncharacterized PurR-regulated membrane protein YhhQ (DUF165 family)
MSSPNNNLTRQAEYSRWFLIVVAIFMTCLFAANIISVKMITIFNLILPAGTIIFPVSYILETF